jgi:GntR family transcriptional regulator, transcriptional repressor for pyruvate dehydrogenase complex
MFDARVSETILQTISAWIVCGEIQDDGMLPPLKKLAAMFGVSIVTIREAIIGLETLGIVQMKHGKGVYVISPDTIIEDLFQTRRELESSMARRAAPVIHTEDIGRMEQHVTAMQKAAEASDLEEYGRHDAPFHVIIYDAAGSVIMRKIVLLLKSGIFSPGHMKNELKHNPRYLEIANKSHWAIFHAVAARDPELAETAVHEHLDRVYRVWSRNLESMCKLVKSELAQM